MLAALLREKEEGEFKLLRNRRIEIDEQRRRLHSLAVQARANSDSALTDIPVLLTYLKTLALQLAGLNDEEEALNVEEQSKKVHLKTALARQMRLEDHNGQ